MKLEERDYYFIKDLGHIFGIGHHVTIFINPAGELIKYEKTEKTPVLGERMLEEFRKEAVVHRKIHLRQLRGIPRLPQRPIEYEKQAEAMGALYEPE